MFQAPHWRSFRCSFFLFQAQVSLLVSLAADIGKGEWILQLAAVLSPTPSASSSASPWQSLLAPLPWSAWRSRARAAYVGAASAVAAACSGLRAGRNAASPLLARLAFHAPLLDGLWERARRAASPLTAGPFPSPAHAAECAAFSFFCDLLSHRLLAVSDDEFLEQYHERTSAAKDLVLTLKHLLNDFYWARPVVAADIARDDPERCQRARLLLSGTKLWNALYERWCRLHRDVQFCDEDCWWFPHLASRGRHDANPILHRPEAVTGGVDAMDDSSVDSGDTDGGGVAAPPSADDAAVDDLANAFRDPKVARVLTCIPQAMPFGRRASLFTSLLDADKAVTQDETTSLRQIQRMMELEEGEEAEITGRERVTIRRDELYGDARRKLNRLGRRLRKRVQVTFVNRHGSQEAG